MAPGSAPWNQQDGASDESASFGQGVRERRPPLCRRPQHYHFPRRHAFLDQIIRYGAASGSAIARRKGGREGDQGRLQASLSLSWTNDFSLSTMKRYGAASGSEAAGEHSQREITRRPRPVTRKLITFVDKRLFSITMKRYGAVSGSE